MADWAGVEAPSLADIEALAEAARAQLPAEFAAAAAGIAVQVAEFAPDDILEEMGIEDPFDLTGLYDGIPLTEKSAFDSPEKPDIIWLFRSAVLLEQPLLLAVPVALGLGRALVGQLLALGDADLQLGDAAMVEIQHQRHQRHALARAFATTAAPVPCARPAACACAARHGRRSWPGA
jgi:predicted Zn-dependent protease with MMP-like domain